MTTSAKQYTAKDIQVLEGLQRFGNALECTLISQLDLHHLVYEVVDNSIDEALMAIAIKSLS